MDYTLSRATEEDAAFLRELFMDVRGPEFQQLLPAVAEQLLAMQFRAQGMSYAARFPEAVDEIVWVEGERAGRLLTSSTAETVHVVDIALLGRYRGQGIGAAVVRGLCARAKASGSGLTLTVRNGNPAVRLYTRMGFVVVGQGETDATMEWQEQVSGADHMAGAESGTEEDAASVGPTRRYFEGLVGQVLKARGAELVVGSVEALPRPTHGAKVEMGDSFVVRLHGEGGAFLGPGMVELATQSGATVEIYLSPVGVEGERMQYEAVFNRMQPR